MPDRHSPDQIERAIHLRESEGLSWDRIARATGMSRGAVQYHCLKHGAFHPRAAAHLERAQYRTTRSFARGGRTVRAFTAAEDRLILDMLDRGARVSDIACHLGRAHSSISGRLLTLARRDAIQEDAHA